MQAKRASTIGLAGAVLLLGLSAAARAQAPVGTITTIAFDPADARRVYAGGYAGVFRSDDAGDTWHRSSRINVAWSLAISPAVFAAGAEADDVVLAGTEFQAVLRSTDRGLTWSGDPDWTGTVRSVAMRKDGTAAYAASESAIYRSENRGTDWEVLTDALAAGPVVTLLIDEADPNLLYAGKRNAGVYRSVDGGVTWQLGSEGLGDSYLVDLDVDPTNASVLYATTLSAVYRSVDAGAGWVPLAFPVATYALAIDATDPQRMIAATTLSGIHRSLDGGVSWQPVNEGLGAVTTFFSSGIAPDGSGRVYAGARDYGLFESADFGDTWRSVSGVVVPPDPDPPPSAGDPAPSLRLDIVDLQGGEAVAAGSSARFRLELTNTGGGDAIGARLHAGWVLLAFLIGQNTPMTKTLSPSQGHCDASGDCLLGTIAPGETVVVEFFGTTRARVLGNYRLSVGYSADNTGYGSATRTIGSSVTVFSSDSGGGGAIGMVELLLLLGVATLGRVGSSGSRPARRTVLRPRRASLAVPQPGGCRRAP